MPLGGRDVGGCGTAARVSGRPASESATSLAGTHVARVVCIRARSVSEKQEHAPSRPASPAKSNNESKTTARAARVLKKPVRHYSDGLLTKLRLKPTRAGGEPSLKDPRRRAAAAKTASKAETCLNRTDFGFRRCLVDDRKSSAGARVRTDQSPDRHHTIRPSGICDGPTFAVE